jgi:RNA polymerase sigma-70 factor (ECF subfamily)
VLQDSFVEAFRDLHQLQDPELFSHWLMRIATHQIHRRFRKRRLLERLGFLSQKDATLELLVDSAASPELRAQCGQLDRALQTLPADERIAWSLRHVEGCQLTEIESLTEASLATVKRRLARAQKRIQSHFEFELPEDEAVEIVPTKTAAEERSDCYEEVGS